MEDKKVILEVKDLKKYFPLGKGKLDKNKKYVKAVDGVSFKLYEGRRLVLLENPAVENPHLDVQFFVCMNRQAGKCTSMVKIF